MINGTSQTVAVIHAFCVRELPVTRKFVPSLNDTGQKTLKKKVRMTLSNTKKA